MTLWKLFPADDDESPPFDGYDTTMGFIIRAETEERARALADANVASYEPSKGAWLDPKLTNCYPVSAEGREAIIMVDFNAG